MRGRWLDIGCLNERGWILLGYRRAGKVYGVQGAIWAMRQCMMTTVAAFDLPCNLPV